ncbi:MAG: hypothetical protein A2527_06060 [Candidatus Lambdaproteobacteria bacterium RIFOXYD2_FULL_50_16]|uniref:D-alanyl-D-alanine carboxypeptidase-like core domain-containing protein n=1 Tax=Candidatus Lambdaproteobacteria bacterium RIFOXYD2_FULL_50_16 TaxID=1817772 RepID=A0A1F6G9H6_9PROT|nr:MAG: hypothetical protein A2527_06060 [Candidatus Lambdaproteobacteria bacterium RIFOXYD2_FULL_50_16]
MIFSPQTLTGQSREHIVQFQEPRFALHPLAAKAFFEMQEEARSAGIELAVFSGFRDFDTQVRIWRLKAAGERPLYNTQGQPIPYASLSPEALIHAILRWSALPGASRHHWGSEIDLIDQRAMPPGYRVELLPHEYAQGGIFGHLNTWIEQNAARFGFFQPYKEDLGGVAPEPWHLSLKELSIPALKALTPGLLQETLQKAELPLSETLLPMVDLLYSRYVINICPPATP